MAEIVYLLCAATSLLCAVLLIRSYRRSRVKLLMWSALCFVCIALNNALLVIDLLVVPDIDLSLARTGAALTGLSLLVIGLVWETR